MIYGLLLAAGTSSRMGHPKQLLDWHGQPMVRHVAQQVPASNLAGLIVVVGAAADRVQAALAGLEITVVTNPDYATGQASSLRAGLRVVPATVDAVVVLLADQPLVTPALINTLVATFRQECALAAPGPLAIIPCYRGQRGNPVLLARALFPELQQLQGDVGARAVLQRYASQIYWLDTTDPAVITDIDTLEAYERQKKNREPER
ncbi:MAG: NTP transferase domain-containing protein [Chloroflexaceae bacterium]